MVTSSCTSSYLNPDWAKGKTALASDGTTLLKPAGWFDMGLGAGYALSNGSNNDPDGLVISIKAYPYGRWYSTRKSPLPSLDKALENVAAINPDAAAAAAAQTTLQEAVSQASNWSDSSGEYLVVKGREKWEHRLAIFFGTSIGEFSNQGIKGDLLTLGVSYDVAPQFALQVGIGVFRVNEVTGGISGPLAGELNTSDTSLFLGVAINASAISAMF
ncbi:MAG: hypothetical protein COA70_12900 [Planctomycetota bacterium]|nr:MAG: hypothetical protein COA70_12900 [Planctomycetota bacterium]